MAVDDIGSATETSKRVNIDIAVCNVIDCHQRYPLLPHAGVPYGQRFCRMPHSICWCNSWNWTCQRDLQAVRRNL